MKVIVYKASDGKHVALVVPGKKARLPPILVGGGSQEDMKEDVRIVLQQLSPDPTPE